MTVIKSPRSVWVIYVQIYRLMCINLYIYLVQHKNSLDLVQSGGKSASNRPEVIPLYVTAGEKYSPGMHMTRGAPWAEIAFLCTLLGSASEYNKE